jgi:hypothetical protein
MSNGLSDAVREAIEKAPCSLRRLAEDAEIPHSTLVRIRDGSLNASPAVVERLMGALAMWAERCDEGQRELKRALRKARSK